MIEDRTFRFKLYEFPLHSDNQGAYFQESARSNFIVPHPCLVVRKTALQKSLYVFIENVIHEKAFQILNGT